MTTIRCGRANLGTTQRYIEGSAEAKGRVVALVWVLSHKLRDHGVVGAVAS